MIDEWKELIMNLMKKLRLGKTIAVLVSMSLLAGCGSKNKVTDDTEKKADKVETTEETTEAAPATGTDVTEADVSEVKVEYGSTIRASTKLKVEGATTSEEDKGETTFVVSKESEEFQYSDYEMSDEELLSLRSAALLEELEVNYGKVGGVIATYNLVGWKAIENRNGLRVRWQTYRTTDLEALKQENEDLTQALLELAEIVGGGNG